MRQNFIAIEGPIGVGKTSLSNLLADHSGEEVKLIHEDVGNPFLDEFYKDKEGSAFKTQLYFLISRYEQMKSLQQRELFQQKIISDFTFEKDKIFAYLTLSDSELLIYNKMYELLYPQIPKPDLVIHLTASLETLNERIAKRGRSFENDIDAEYLVEVSDAYVYYFEHYKDTPLLVVNTDEIDYVNNKQDLFNLIDQINNTTHGVVYYNP